MSVGRVARLSGQEVALSRADAPGAVGHVFPTAQQLGGEQPWIQLWGALSD